MNNSLIHPQVQSDENVCVEQPAIHYYLLRICYIYIHFIPFSEEGQTR